MFVGYGIHFGSFRGFGWSRFGVSWGGGGGAEKELGIS